MDDELPGGDLLRYLILFSDPVNTAKFSIMSHLAFSSAKHEICCRSELHVDHPIGVIKVSCKDLD